MFTITRYNKISKFAGQADFKEAIKVIREERFVRLISNIRRLKSVGKTEEANKLKQSLPSFTASGVFSRRRKVESLHQYNPLFVLDIDKIDDLDMLYSVRQKAVSNPHTLACFISPSGNGLKIFVRSDNTQIEHENTFNLIADHYESLLCIPIDRSGKDITRLCFLSADKECFYNPEAQVFQSEVECVAYGFVDDIMDHSSIYLKTLEFTKINKQYFDGNRNNFVHQFACNCNRVGHELEQTIAFCYENFSDLPHNEIERTVKSAYNNNADEFATSAVTATINESMEQTSHDTDFLMESITIPNKVYENLPSFLKRYTSPFLDLRERDIVLTSALVSLSGILQTVTGKYNQEIFHPNIFSFIIAPSAAGKGVMKYAYYIAQSVDDYLIHQSTIALAQYHQELADYESLNDEERAEMRPPRKPLFKSLLIPGNTSYAKLMDHLRQNSGDGLIFESEADAVGYSLSREWGSYSDMLRKAFHHETISASRMSSLPIRISSPRVSICLSGTPNQILQLIPSAEDGLFSRFIYYAFNAPVVWKDVSPGGYQQDLTIYFSFMSDESLEIYKHFEANPAEIFLNNRQWPKLNNHFSEMLKSTTFWNEAESSSIVKRLGITAFRFYMIFSALRIFENRENDNPVDYSDVDIDNALELANIYLHHSLLIFVNMQKANEFRIKNKNSIKTDLFNSLPDEFTRKQAVDAGVRLNISTRSVDNILKSLLGTYLEKIFTGRYKKKNLQS